MTGRGIAGRLGGPGASALVLCYHALSERWPTSLAVTPARFERQVSSLLRRGYRGVTFSEAVGGGQQGDKVLAVTFDDAFRSVADEALPILSRLGLPGTVFVPTDFPDGDGLLRWPGIDGWLDSPYRPELGALSWDDLRRLGAAGWEIGSHTRSHPRLTQLDDDRLRHELRGSREICQERTGRPCVSLAYPYGDVDPRVVRAAEEAGYRSAGGLPVRSHALHLSNWPRIGIYRKDAQWRFRLKVSRVAAPLRRVRSLIATPRGQRPAAARTIAARRWTSR